MKKLILIVILVMSVVGCSLLDNEAYQEMKQERRERGVRCYRENGYYQCWDRYGNRTY
mgnify:CR=1 FL=1